MFATAFENNQEYCHDKTEVGVSGHSATVVSVGFESPMRRQEKWDYRTPEGDKTRKSKNATT